MLTDNGTCVTGTELCRCKKAQAENVSACAFSGKRIRDIPWEGYLFTAAPRTYCLCHGKRHVEKLE